MSFSITDGAGSGVKVKVDARQKLKIAGVTESESIFSTSQGDGYNINTGYISISGDSGLAYLKNDSDKILVVDSIAIGSRDGATYSNKPYITILRNPTGGTVISEAVEMPQNANRNFGSSNTFNGKAYKAAASGKTITGGNEIATLQLNTSARSFFTIDFFLPKGSSIGVNLTAEMSAGAADYYLAFICYLLDPDIF